MPKRYDIMAEARRVAASQNRWGSRIVDVAHPRAMNRIANTVRSRGGKKIAVDMGAKQRDVRKSSKIQRARRRRPLAAVIWAGRPLTLIAFQPRQTRRGVTAKAWGQRKLYRGAFIATMPTGKRQTVTRKGKARLPLKTLYGPSVPRTAARRENVNFFNRIVRDRYAPEMRSAIRSLERR